MTLKWNWIPNKSLGLIEIGIGIDHYVKKLNATYIAEPPDATGWEAYEISEFEINIAVSDGEVVSITSYKEFLYKEYNLIGLELKALDTLLGCSADEIDGPVEYDNGDVTMCYDYDALGLQIWMQNNTVHSATCMTYEGLD
ncbi:MAG: hypothetical protein ABJN40_14945 [Sneathiella sp.]